MTPDFKPLIYLFYFLGSMTFVMAIALLILIFS